MLYSVKITSEDGEVIEIGKEGIEGEKNLITDFSVHMDTIDNDSRQKSMAMLAKITLKGSIDEIISGEIIGLFNWAKALEKNKWYRSLEVKVKIDMNETFRTYQFDNVFVVDYLEVYKTESAQGDSSATNADKDHFELYLTQKESNFKNIESY